MSSNRFVHALLGLALLATVLAQARPLSRHLSFWARGALTQEPSEIRERYNPMYARAAEIVESSGRDLPSDVPVLLGPEDKDLWFIALELQPRPVFLDSPEKRRQLAEQDRYYRILTLDGTGASSSWTVVDVGGPLIFRDGFEQGIDAWVLEPVLSESH